MEVRETRLEEDLAGFWDVVLLVRGLRLLGREGVHEAVSELLERERHDPVPAGRMGQCRRNDFERRERQHEDSLRRRWAHRHAPSGEPAVEQELDNQAAERVADQDRLMLESPDLRLVVVDDLGQAKPFDGIRRLTQLLDLALLAWPFWGRDVIAPVAEVLGERVPAPR